MVLGSIYIFCFHIKERKDKEEEAAQKVQKNGRNMWEWFMIKIFEEEKSMFFSGKMLYCHNYFKINCRDIFYLVLFPKKTFSFHFFGWPRVKEMFQPDYHLPYQEDKRLLMIFQNFYAQKLFGKTKRKRKLKVMMGMYYSYCLTWS